MGGAALCAVLAALLTCQADAEVEEVYLTFSVWMTDTVKSDMRDEYVETTKLWIEEVRKRGIPLSINCFRDAHGNYEYGSREYAPAEMERVVEAWQQAMAILDESDWSERRKDSLVSTKLSLWTREAELSYSPETSDLPPGGVDYFLWYSIRVSPARERDFVVALAGLNSDCGEKQVGVPYSVFRNITGEEGPFYAIVVPSIETIPSSDLVGDLKRILGEEFEATLQALAYLADEITAGHGWTERELSINLN